MSALAESLKAEAALATPKIAMTNSLLLGPSGETTLVNTAYELWARALNSLGSPRVGLTVTFISTGSLDGIPPENPQVTAMNWSPSLLPVRDATGHTSATLGFSRALP